MTTNRPDNIQVPNDGFGFAYKRAYRSWFLDYCRGFHSNYKCKVLHRDAISLVDLKVGQRIGLCVTQSGELHFYVNGINKETLCTGLPTDVSYWGFADVYRKTTKVQLMSPEDGNLKTASKKVQPLPLKQESTKDHFAQTEGDQHRQVKVQANELELLQVKLQELKTKNEDQELEKQKLQEKIQEIQHEHENEKIKLNTANQQLQISNQNLTVENQELQVANQELQTTNQELQGNVARLSIENMRLNEQVKELKQQKVTAVDESWKVNYKEVTLTKQELGRGGWGVIWIGEFRGQKVAVKQMHELIVSPEFLQLLNREINTMAQLRHPNLLQFIGAVLDHPSGNPMIITEIMDISLRGAYEKKQLSPVPVSICLSIMRDVAVGLNYLHCLPDPIIHRDVSSANVLLESKGPGKWKTKISDFGSAKFARSAVTTAAGAAVYSAPESFQSVAFIHKKKQTTKMDVFSYGVLLLEVMSCQFPGSVDVFQNLLEQLKISSIHQLILQCISEDPEHRPTIKQVIQQLDSINN